MAQRGIILANTGSPAAPTPEAVRAYLREFLSDPRICPMNPLLWRVILNAFILPRRSVASAQKYAAIWTPQGSPLSVTTGRLAQALEDSLNAQGPDADPAAPAPADAPSRQAVPTHRFLVRYAMSYGVPSMEDALQELRNGGCQDITVIPLYPQGAFSTTSVVRDKLQAALGVMAWQPKMGFVADYCRSPLYVQAIAQSVLQQGFDPAQDRLLMVFHSIPMPDIDGGDAYGRLAHDTASQVASQLGLQDRSDRWALGFQCRFDKSRQWLGPFVGEVLQGIPDDGRRLFAVAPNFAIDCLESLYDIDIMLRGNLAQSHPGTPLHYVPCLNDSPAQVALLESLL